MSNSVFDCTKLSDFHHEICRLCKSFGYGEVCEQTAEACKNTDGEICPLWSTDACYSLDAISFITYGELCKIAAIVQDWSDSHPQTRAELIKIGKVSVQDFLNDDTSVKQDGISW